MRPHRSDGLGRTPTLPELAFMNCTALQEVTLPDDVRVIGSSAFFGCAALTTVNLSQVTWINLNAFYECTSLEMLILDNVTEIGREISTDAQVSKRSKYRSVPSSAIISYRAAKLSPG